MDHKKIIQILANLLSDALGFDVGVVGRDRVTIAGTGTFKKNVGLRVPRRSLAAKSLFMQQSYFVKEGSLEPDCYNCKFRNICPYNMALINPIVSNDMVEATIFLLSTNENQRNFMANRKKYLKKNLKDIAAVMANNVLKNNPNAISYDFNSNFNAIMNSLREGILVTGENRNIEYLNSVAEEILGYKKNELQGGDIDRLFLKNDCSSNCCLERLKSKRNISYQIDKIVSQNKLAGYVIYPIQAIENRSKDLLPFKNAVTFEKIIGKSLAVKTAIDKAKRIANSESSVLLLGETGTGKDLFARAIHQASYRRDKNFVTLNCSAIPENLLESEMFGYEEGAFTGTKKGGKPGKFQKAHGGTLFLDEIGDMPKILQSKLLRVLEDGAIEKLGGTKTEKVDVRIISATNKNLEQMVLQGTFRKDLYYRLNVIPIRIPPLRERREDILPLSDHFLSKFAKKPGCLPKFLSETAKNIFLNYSWNGNVRELKNVIEYMVQILQKDHIETEDLPESMREFDSSKLKAKNYTASPEAGNRLQLLEKSAIEETIKKFGSSTEAKIKTAQHLGISLTTLYRRLKYYEISNPRKIG